MVSCKLCDEEFEQLKEYQKICSRCYYVQKGYHNCDKKKCKNLVKPTFSTCWSCQKNLFKPCPTDGCKKYIKKNSDYKSCYNCNKEAHTPPLNPLFNFKRGF